MVNLTCDEGFHVSRFARQDGRIQTVSCEENGVWVPPLRKCISDNNGQLILVLKRFFITGSLFVVS